MLPPSPPDHHFPRHHPHCPARPQPQPFPVHHHGHRHGVCYCGPQQGHQRRYTGAGGASAVPPHRPLPASPSKRRKLPGSCRGSTGKSSWCARGGSPCYGARQLAQQQGHKVSPRNRHRSRTGCGPLGHRQAQVHHAAHEATGVVGRLRCFLSWRSRRRRSMGGQGAAGQMESIGRHQPRRRAGAARSSRGVSIRGRATCAPGDPPSG